MNVVINQNYNFDLFYFNIIFKYISFFFFLQYYVYVVCNKGLVYIGFEIVVYNIYINSKIKKVREYGLVLILFVVIWFDVKFM